MIIGIDGNEANVSKRVGIGEYAFELLRQFKKINPPAGGSSIKYQVYVKNKPLGDLPEEDSNWKYRVIGPRKLWTQIALPLDLFLHRPRPDVFFTPTHYTPRFSPIPAVISIMDLSFIFYPEMFKKSDLFQLTNWTAYSVRKATKILTISKASKDDIIKIYKVKSSKVEVIYPGIKAGFRMDKKENIIEGEYILFVGTLQPRKNIVRLIEAFSQVVKKHPKIKLVIVGKKGWLYEDILNAPQKFSVEEKVTFLDFVSNEELASLYQHALCFVLPSLYEGFGLPVLEAMKYDCPVITSNVSSLPEAGGEAALYIDPLDVSDIARKLEKIITDPDLRKELIEKGKKQIKKFSWEKSAQETLKVLQILV